MSKETTRIMVLNDGETFTALGGCQILEVPADWDTEKIEDAISNGLPLPIRQTFYGSEPESVAPVA